MGGNDKFLLPPCSTSPDYPSQNKNTGFIPVFL